MKKAIALLLSVLFTFLSVMPAAALQPAEADVAVSDGSQALLDSVLEYIEQNTTVTVHPDGTKTIMLAPVAGGNGNGGAVGDRFPTDSPAQRPNSAAVGADYGYVTNQRHTAIPLQDRFIYSLLNKEDQNAYRQIDEAVRNFKEYEFFDSASDLITNGALYFLYVFDTPELFYLGNAAHLLIQSNGIVEKYGYSFSYAVSNEEYYIYDPQQHELLFPDRLRNKIEAKQATFSSAVSDFLSTIPADAPDLIKERLIYAKILRNSHYNIDALREPNNVYNDNWTAYGIMCNGAGVCESYSEALQLLCNAVGIRCTGVVGEAKGDEYDNNWGPHKWNAVQIDGEWYQCDATYDDPIGGAPNAAYSQHFNVTDQQMAALFHHWEPHYGVSAPACTATANGRDVFLALYSEDDNGTIHRFKSGCDTTCENCSMTREAGNSHDYENDCDTTCGVCGAVRTIKHSYKGACSTECSVCDAPREPVGDHTYSNAIDITCNVCGYERTLSLSGWVQEGNRWMCFVNGVKQINRWMKDSVGWVYLGADGYMLTNRWVRDSVGWCYVGANGYAVTNCWKKDSVGWCYLNANGSMTKNKWVKDGGKWYYCDGNGYMMANKWMKDSVGWVYLGSSGAMLTNAWVRDSVGWCYVGGNGYAVTNCWKKDSVGWCYLNANGSMTKNAWVKDGGKWYYCDGNGYMVTGRRLIGGKYYTFNGAGVWVA